MNFANKLSSFRFEHYRLLPFPLLFSSSWGTFHFSLSASLGPKSPLVVPAPGGVCPVLHVLGHVRALLALVLPLVPVGGGDDDVGSDTPPAQILDGTDVLGQGGLGMDLVALKSAVSNERTLLVKVSCTFPCLVEHPQVFHLPPGDVDRLVHDHPRDRFPASRVSGGPVVGHVVVRGREKLREEDAVDRVVLAAVNNLENVKKILARVLW